MGVTPKKGILHYDKGRPFSQKSSGVAQTVSEKGGKKDPLTAWNSLPRLEALLLEQLPNDTPCLWLVKGRETDQIVFSQSTWLLKGVVHTQSALQRDVLKQLAPGRRFCQFERQLGPLVEGLE